MYYTLFETETHTVKASRIGDLVLSRKDGSEVYFQPGDDAAAARFALGLETEDGEGLDDIDPATFDRSAADYMAEWPDEDAAILADLMSNESTARAVAEWLRGKRNGAPGYIADHGARLQRDELADRFLKQWDDSQP